MEPNQPKKRGRPPANGKTAMSKAERQKNWLEKSGTKQAGFLLSGPFVDRLDSIAEFYGIESRSKALQDLLSHFLQMQVDILENARSSIEQIEDQGERERHKREVWEQITNFQETFNAIKQIRKEAFNDHDQQ